MLHTIFNKILEAAPYKTAAIQPLTFHLKNHPSKMNKACWVLLEREKWTHKWYYHMDTPAAGQSVNNLHSSALSVDTGCHLENFPTVMTDKDKCQKRVKESMHSAHFDDDDVLLGWVKSFAIFLVVCEVQFSISRWFWRRWTTLGSEMLSLPDTLWVLRTRFTSMAWSTILESTVFWHIWSCLIIKFLATQVKFLEPSGYCAMIYCAITFHTENVFGSFHCSMAKFEIIKHKFLN